MDSQINAHFYEGHIANPIQTTNPVEGQLGCISTCINSRYIALSHIRSCEPGARHLKPTCSKWEGGILTEIMIKAVAGHSTGIETALRD